LSNYGVQWSTYGRYLLALNSSNFSILSGLDGLIARVFYTHNQSLANCLVGEAYGWHVSRG
jgi:hypothetical protein